jgi:hypothetical protein
MQPGKSTKSATWGASRWSLGRNRLFAATLIDPWARCNNILNTLNTGLINKAVCIILMQRLGHLAPISKKKVGTDGLFHEIEQGAWARRWRPRASPWRWEAGTRRHWIRKLAAVLQARPPRRYSPHWGCPGQLCDASGNKVVGYQQPRRPVAHPDHLVPGRNSCTVRSVCGAHCPLHARGATDHVVIDAADNQRKATPNVGALSWVLSGVDMYMASSSPLLLPPGNVRPSSLDRVGVGGGDSYWYDRWKYGTKKTQRAKTYWWQLHIIWVLVGGQNVLLLLLGIDSLLWGQNSNCTITLDPFRVNKTYYWHLTNNFSLVDDSESKS